MSEDFENNGNHGKTIGEMNGKWAILFRATLLTVSVLLMPAMGLLTWQVTSIFELRQQIGKVENKIEVFIAEGPRYTPTDARADHLKLYQEIQEWVNANFPPPHLQKEVESHGRRIEALEKKPN